MVPLSENALLTDFSLNILAVIVLLYILYYISSREKKVKNLPLKRRDRTKPTRINRQIDLPKLTPEQKHQIVMDHLSEYYSYYSTLVD